MSTRDTGEKPDLVGRAELAERLGVNASTMSRWHRRSILPDPDLVLDGQELWLWDTVREWTRHRFTQRRAVSVAVPDIVALADLADRLGMDGRTIDLWHKSGFLPEPDYRWESTEGWLWETIDRWSHSGLSGRTPWLNPPDVTAPTHPSQPDGPKLRIAESPASLQVAVSAAGPEPPSGSVAAVPVTPVREPSRDPIGELERLHRYFAEMAATYRAVTTLSDS